MFKRIKSIKFNSIRFKVSLYYTAIIAAILIFYTGILYFAQRYALYRDLDRSLTIKAQEVSHAIDLFLPVMENDLRAFSQSANSVIQKEPGDDYIVLSSVDGQAIANSQNVDEKLLPNLLNQAAGAAQKAVSYRNFKLSSLQLRLVTIPYYYKNKRVFLLQIGSSRIPIIRILNGRLLIALLTIPLVLLFAIFLGGVITKRILGPVMHITGIAKSISYKDLTARVKLEQVDEELRYLVDAFNEMISRLESSFRHIDEFSSNVAHELKTPLTIAIGESELALMQERDSEEYKRVIEVNLSEAGHMLKIIDDLLLLSKIEYDPSVFKFERIDLSLFMMEIYEQAKKLAMQKNISVHLDMPDKQVTIQADWLHLRRLFINLINNAIKFTPQDGKITISVRPRHKKVAVLVSDTGIGISPENLNKIFDRFFHIDHPGTDKTSSGLGLSIAQSIAKIHHGRIFVKSQPQKGSTFIVTLPI